MIDIFIIDDKNDLTGRCVKKSKDKNGEEQVGDSRSNDPVTSLDFPV